MGRPKGSKNKRTAVARGSFDRLAPKAIDIVEKALNSKVWVRQRWGAEIVFDRHMGKPKQPITVGELPDLENMTEEQLDQWIARLQSRAQSG